MKRVLFISYYFPPAGGSAVQRVSKFVKYLHHSGWQPVVLTARAQDYILRDDSLCSEIPANVKIIRTPAPDLYRWYGKMVQDMAKADLSAIAAGENKKTTVLKRLAIFIRAAFFIPDARIGWLPSALWYGLRIIHREKIRIIFTTSPPFTTAVIGGLLSALTKVPWISDYRDPWTQAYFYFPRPQLSQSLENFMERRLLFQANRIISINRRIFAGLKEKYGNWENDKGTVIPNGYDPEDFHAIEPVIDDYFTITYTGTMNTKMHPGPLLEAVAQLSEDGPEFGQKVRLNFIGRIGEDVVPMFKDKRIVNKIKVIPHMPHRECLRYTAGADLLLLLIPEWKNNELIMTGKLFEYLRSGVPILCLADRGEAADLVRKTATGFTVRFRDVERIKAILWESFQSWRKGNDILNDPIQWDHVEKFDRKKGTEKLAGLFDDVDMNRQNRHNIKFE